MTLTCVGDWGRRVKVWMAVFRCCELVLIHLCGVVGSRSSERTGPSVSCSSLPSLATLRPLFSSTCKQRYDRCHYTSFVFAVTPTSSWLFIMRWGFMPPPAPCPPSARLKACLSMFQATVQV